MLLPLDPKGMGLFAFCSVIGFIAVQFAVALWG
jgi:hypothetical protein